MALEGSFKHALFSFHRGPELQHCITENPRSIYFQDHMSPDLPYPGFPSFQVSFCSSGACSRCAALQRFTLISSAVCSKTNMKTIRLIHRLGGHAGSKTSTTQLSFSTEPGGCLFLWQKAAVHLGKMILAKDKLAEADIHFAFMVTMQRNVTIFRLNSTVNRLFVPITKKQLLLIPQFGCDMGTISFIRSLDVEQIAAGSPEKRSLTVEKSTSPFYLRFTW